MTSAFVLELPGDDDHVTLTDPDPLFDLSRYPAHSGHAVCALHYDVVGAEHAGHVA
jgi:hypothetical protein